MFYDGECGLCHGLVKFALPRDRDGALAFAPLHGETFRARLDAERAAALPDSLVYLARSGELLLRSDAALRTLERLPGAWPVIARILRVLPKPLRDWGYDRIARVRKIVFAPPDGACPVAPPHLRDRLLP